MHESTVFRSLKSSRSSRRKSRCKSVAASVATGLALCSVAQFKALAADNYTVVKKADGTSGVSFSIGYTLGTHRGTAESVNGNVQVSENNGALTIESARILVPIASLRSGNALRDCHMTEALGLDYALSTYPEAGHLCQNNSLPQSGPDSVAFPNIELNLDSVAADGTLAELNNGKVLIATALAKWNIHGIERDSNLTLELRAGNGGRVVAKTQAEFSLAEFGIEVIPWAGLISVKDKATVQIELEFAKSSVRPESAHLNSLSGSGLGSRANLSSSARAARRVSEPLGWREVFAQVIGPNCTGCHNPNNPSRVNLTNYASFKEVYTAVYALTLFALNPEDERMPPGGPGLDREKKQILADYLVQGLPELASPEPSPAPAH